MNGTKSLVESSLLTGLAVVLFLAARYIPVAGIVLSLLCPGPLVILGLRHRPKMAFVGLVSGTFLVALLSGPVSALSFFLGFGILGVGLGVLASRLEKAQDIMLYGILISLVSKLVLMVVLTKLTGVNPFDPDVENLRSSLDKVLSMYAGSLSLEEVKSQVEATLQAIPLMFPAMITVASAVDCFLSYWISRKILVRIGGAKLPALPDFKSWRFPKSLLWAFAFSLVLLAFDSSLKNPVLSRVSLNLHLLVSLIFMIQGLSVAADYMDFRNSHKVLKYMALALILFMPFLSQLAVIVGLLDMWIDIRSRYRR